MPFWRRVSQEASYRKRNTISKVLICRPFVTAVYGGGAEGVKCYIDKLAGELADTMQMCGAHTLAEITPDMVRV